jgi:hypothetical protein
VSGAGPVSRAESCTDFDGKKRRNSVEVTGPALQKKWDDGEIKTAEELRLRLLILLNVSKADFQFGDSDHLRLGPDWKGTKPKPGKEIEAHIELWAKKNRKMGCTLGSTIAIRKAIIDSADENSWKLTVIRAEMQKYFAEGNTDDSPFWERKEKKGGFKTYELIPGDLIFLKSPAWSSVTPKDIHDHPGWAGEEGSHQFYIGGGKIISVFRLDPRFRVQTIEHQQGDVMAHWGSVTTYKPNATGKDFPITLQYRPLVLP